MGSATGVCVGCVLKEAAADLSLNIDDLDIVIQGFDNVGAWTSKLLREPGCKIIEVSDVEGGIYNPRGWT